jgi:glycosyltransferase involved in cell wall biosynthesis
LTASRDHLKVLYVGTFPPFPGGTAVALSRFLAGLAGRGYEIRALTPMVADPPPSDASLLADRIEVATYPVPYFAIEPDKVSDEYISLEGQHIRDRMPGLAADFRPHLVLIGRESFVWHVPDIARELGLPSIMFVHSVTTESAARGTDQRARAMIEHYRKVDLVVSPAKHLAEPLRSVGLTNVEVIPNVVDLMVFRPTSKPRALMDELGLGTDDVVAVHASNLKPIKRPHDIVESAERALDQQPSLRYVIVGDGPCRESLETECSRRGIADRFRFTGWVENSKIPEYLNVADLVLMPSEYETQAMVYLEALATGRLLLASRVAGAEEVIDEGRTGLLHEPGDVDDLTSQTLVAARDPALRRDIGRRARQAAEAHSVSRGVAALAAAIETLVGAHDGDARSSAGRVR